jgi:hypothetical protein
VRDLASLSSKISTLDYRYFVADYFLVRGYFAEEEKKEA